jgi:hypothetical protein
MINTLIGIILVLIVVGVLFWAVQTLLPLIPLPEPFRRIIYVLLVVILVLIVVYVIAELLGATLGSMRLHASLLLPFTLRRLT